MVNSHQTMTNEYKEDFKVGNVRVIEASKKTRRQKNNFIENQLRVQLIVELVQIQMNKN